MRDALLQVPLALLYYAALVLLFRLSGKRLAGQTTSFDLLVLIGLSVVLQEATFRPGPTNAVIFVATVWLAHRTMTVLTQRSRPLRRLLRGSPRPLVSKGQVSLQALEDENMSYDDLLAGLRKLGYAHPREVDEAVLEETGHISAVAARRSSS